MGSEAAVSSNNEEVDDCAEGTGGTQEGWSEGLHISTTLLRALFRIFLGKESDVLVDRLFEECVENSEWGTTCVTGVFDSIARLLLESTTDTTGDGVRVVAQKFAARNRKQMGAPSCSSFDLDVTGRRMKARVRAIDEFSAAIHGFDNCDDVSAWYFQYFSRGSKRIRYLLHILEAAGERDVMTVVARSKKLRELLHSILILKGGHCNGVGTGAVVDARTTLRLMYMVGMTRRQGDSLIKELSKFYSDVPRSKGVWAYREQLIVLKSMPFTPNERDPNFDFGFGRFIDTRELLENIFKVGAGGGGGSSIIRFYILVR